MVCWDICGRWEVGGGRWQLVYGMMVVMVVMGSRKGKR
jgi:hypothetical protein